MTRAGLEVSVPIGAIAWSQEGAEARTLQVAYENDTHHTRFGRMDVRLVDFDTGDLEIERTALVDIRPHSRGSLPPFHFARLPYPGRKLVTVDVSGDVFQSEVIYVFPDLLG